MDACYISDIEYHGKPVYYIAIYDEDVEFTIRSIETNKIVTHYDCTPYGYTSEGIFATNPIYWRLYETLDFSHIEHSLNFGINIDHCVDINKTLFKLKTNTLHKDVNTLGGILVNTNWYYIKDDLLYMTQLNGDVLVYKIIDMKGFNTILAKIRTLSLT